MDDAASALSRFQHPTGGGGNQHHSRRELTFFGMKLKIREVTNAEGGAKRRGNEIFIVLVVIAAGGQFSSSFESLF